MKMKYLFDMETLIKKGKENIHNIKQAAENLKKTVDNLFDDEYSKVPISIKMELRAIEKKIRECL